MAMAGNLAKALAPLDIELIRDKLFGYLNPNDVISCRLLSRLWCNYPTPVLERKGWSIHLRDNDRLEKYLFQILPDLIRTSKYLDQKTDDTTTNDTGDTVTDETDDTSTATSTTGDKREDSATERLSLPLSLYINFMKNSDRALSIIGEPGFRVKALQVIISANGPHENYWSTLLPILQACSASLEHISFIIPDFYIGMRSNPCERGSLQLPRLQSFSVEYNGQGEGDGTLEDELCMLVSVAPKLTSLRGQRGGRSSRHISSSVLCHVQFHDRAKLGGLVELELYIGRFYYLEQLGLEGMTFTSLQKLILHTPDDLGRLSDTHRHYLLDFVITKCPVLTSLEVINTHVDPAPLSHPPLLTNEAVALRSPLPTITHFTFQYHLKHPFEHHWLWNPNASAVQRLRALFWVLERLPNLNTFTTNLEACVAMAKFTRESTIPIQQLFLPMSTVKSLFIDVAHSSLHENLDPQDIIEARTVIKNLFPCLDRLVINLGADRVAWKTTTDLGELLVLVFGLDGISNIVINNYYNAWKWTQPRLEAGVNWATTLHALSIHGITRAFANQHTDPALHESACINYLDLLDAIPISIKTGLDLQIDTALVLKAEPDKSYNQMLEVLKKLSSGESPSIKSIRLI